MIGYSTVLPVLECYAQRRLGFSWPTRPENMSISNRHEYVCLLVSLQRNLTRRKFLAILVELSQRSTLQWFC